MDSQLIPLVRVGERELEAWRELAQRALSPNPFAEPEFVLPAARAFGVHDVQLLVVEANGSWLAATPVRDVRAWRGVPGRCLASWRHEYCYLGVPLVAPEDPERTLAAMAARALRHHGCLVLDWVDADGPLAETRDASFARAGRVTVFEQFERAAIFRDENAVGAAVSIKADHRRDHARRRRRLERELPGLEVRDESQNPGAWDRFMELECSGWKGRRETALAARPEGREFFRELCRGFAGDDRLVLLSLASEEQTVAMVCDLVAGDTSHGFKSAYDERFARFSPGVQLHLELLTRFPTAGLGCADSCCAPDNATANRLWPGRRSLQSIALSAYSPTGAAVAAKWRLAREVRRRREYRQHERSAGGKSAQALLPVPSRSR
jgi:CelD/BcsL family acetyltransferase involved in cellulose biosynthesis